METEEFVRRLSQGSGFHIERIDGSEAAGGYRCLPPPEHASGQGVGYYDYQNLCVTMRKLEVKQDFYDDEPGLGRLVFLLHLSGSRRIELGNSHQNHLTAPTLAVYYLPQGVFRRSVWTRGVNEVSMTVGVWPDRLASLLGFYPICFPNFWCSRGDKAEAFWYSRPLPYTLMSAAEGLLNPSVHPLLLKNYISTKSQELLCLSLSTLLSDGELLSRPDLHLKRVEHVKTMVDANLKDPPALSKLATTLGVCAEELSNELREETGVNYVQYITERRMNRAMLLLGRGDSLLKQIAYEVGYAHTSNFCTAFKRHFGTTPKDVRGQ
ncbi:AraC family transcriptional regulator [Mesorhizobium sp. WSM3224]|uniref:helix-turn-helix transcriptional regulator n=1 Tax=Mesorhizobium sp. WSM3224 TaxID=1040986 RepID=UPI0004836B08|nr:AraC family transcriptional regulator [Mesorhizobium sp. WSM3224]